MMVPMGSSSKIEMSLSWFMKMKEGRQCGKEAKGKRMERKKEKGGKVGEREKGKEARRKSQKRKTKCGRKKGRKRK